MPALQKKHKKSSVHNIKSVMNTRYGPSDRVRTCGLMVPNHPRYQLRHTRIFAFWFLGILLSVVIDVVRGNFEALFKQGSNPAIARVSTASGVSLLPAPDTGTPLPKQARCQLRYTPKNACGTRQSRVPQMSS